MAAKGRLSLRDGCGCERGRGCTDRSIGVVLSSETPDFGAWLSMDDPAWHAWYDRHAACLLLYARQWLADRASAEDAVQGGFVKV